MEGLGWEVAGEASRRAGLSLAPANDGLLVEPLQHSHCFAPLGGDLFAQLQPIGNPSLLAVEAPLLLLGEAPPLLLVEFLPPGCRTYP